MPTFLHGLVWRYREMLKFAVVGGAAFLVDNAVFYGLKLTVLEPKPVTAKVIAVLVATIVSYVLNREWSFRTRGGRERHHEAALFFLVSGVGLVLSSVPLWISRYVLLLETPHVTLLTQEIADFTSAQLIGTLVAMIFRFWAFRKWVFPDEDTNPPVTSALPRPPQGRGGMTRTCALTAAAAILVASTTTGCKAWCETQARQEIDQLKQIVMDPLPKAVSESVMEEDDCESGSGGSLVFRAKGTMTSEQVFEKFLAMGWSRIDDPSDECSRCVDGLDGVSAERASRGVYLRISDAGDGSMDILAAFTG
ncbi:GtrA family protein [Nonomuraea salmonea]|uniref:GtrA family protein n=1 Tax=Nonomuraea salmonea TaxID=46181 RepID=UPI0031E84E16